MGTANQVELILEENMKVIFSLRIPIIYIQMLIRLNDRLVPLYAINFLCHPNTGLHLRYPVGRRHLF
jgi:hypothetical protein